jgi:hypothetical protein
VSVLSASMGCDSSGAADNHHDAGTRDAAAMGFLAASSTHALAAFVTSAKTPRRSTRSTLAVCANLTRRRSAFGRRGKANRRAAR